MTVKFTRRPTFNSGDLVTVNGEVIMVVHNTDLDLDVEFGEFLGVVVFSPKTQNIGVECIHSEEAAAYFEGSITLQNM